MDKKVIKYRQILIRLLEEYVENRSATKTALQSILIADKEKNHFQVVVSGWYEGEYFYDVMFHFEIKPEGKIWLLQNNTDIPIAEELAERGIPKTDIILGFQPESLRPYSGFATA